MRTTDFVVKELGRRKMKLVVSILCVVLGIAIFIAAQTIGDAMHTKTEEELYKFGSNILVQPRSESIETYFGSVTESATIPEGYVDKIWEIEHRDMLRVVSPKVYKYFDVGDVNLMIAGVTGEELKLKSWWRIDDMLVGDEFPQGNEVLLGHYAAARLRSPEEIRLKDETFTVTGVLDETGSADDYMAFVPLGVLQNLIGRKRLVNVIEIASGCIACEGMNIYDHAKEIDAALPDDARVIPIKQIAEAQIGTLTKVEGLVFVICSIVLCLSAFVVMNYMFSSVSEQRHEIGILLAIGMDAHQIYKFFIVKALIIGVVGGLLGYVAGTTISMVVGHQIAGTSVPPLLELLPYSIIISTVICTTSSILPARRATQLDPVEALQVM